MKIIVSGGGTGGHIYPAIAIAQYFEDVYNAEILFCGTLTRMEKDIVPKYGFKYKGFDITGIKKTNPFSIFTVFIKLQKAKKEAKKTITNFTPDFVIGCGGYPTVPILSSAQDLGIKTAIFEPDALPGIANKFLSSKVKMIFVSSPSVVDFYEKKNKKVKLINSPINNKIKKIDSKERFKKQKITILGGSLGSTYLNEFAIVVAKKFPAHSICLISGKGRYDEICEAIKTQNILNINVLPYSEEMAGIYNETTVLVSRAGATTIAEVSVACISTIFIPSPNVTNNHQYVNAQQLVNDDAAYCFEEANENTHEILKTLEILLSDYREYDKLYKNIEKLNYKSGAQTIVEEIYKNLGEN